MHLARWIIVILDATTVVGTATSENKMAPGKNFLPAAELSGLRELFFRFRVIHHLSHLHSLFPMTTYGKFDFSAKVTSREN